MNVHFGKRTIAYPGPLLGELRSSNDLLHSADALRRRLDEDGYLLIRGMIDRQKVLAARQTIFAYMDEQDGLEPGSRPLDGVMGEYGKSVNMLGRKGISHHPDVRAVFEGEELFDFYNRLFGEPSITFDYKWLRAVGREQYTGAHYDVVYMGRGTNQLMTCWLPLGDVAIEQGVLAICEGSHNAPAFDKLRDTYGRADVDRDLIHGWFSTDPQEIVEQFGGRWKTTSFRAGDVLTFGMHCMHASTTNTTDRWRLSCDVRFQPAAAPIDERWRSDNPVGIDAYVEAHDQGRIKTIEASRREWGV
jgi:hypothetical protein